jgi:hypothetical protein
MVVLGDYPSGRTSTVHDGGIAGDVLTTIVHTTSETLSLYRTGRLTHTAVRYFTDERVLSRLLAPDFKARLSLELALEGFVAELRRHQDAANAISSFRLANRMRRQITLAPLGIYRNIRRVYCPYLDHDLYDVLASIPEGIPA